MSVIDPNGYPHTVPVWFGMDGDDIMVITFRKTRKNDYLLKNPKGNISIGGDPADSPGYMIKGNFTLEEDPDQRWLREVTLRRTAHRRMGEKRYGGAANEGRESRKDVIEFNLKRLRELVKYKR
jgi:hypothetical protein